MSKRSQRWSRLQFCRRSKPQNWRKFSTVTTAEVSARSKNNIRIKLFKTKIKHVLLNSRPVWKVDIQKRKKKFLLLDEEFYKKFALRIKFQLTYRWSEKVRMICFWKFETLEKNGHFYTVDTLFHQKQLDNTLNQSSRRNDVKTLLPTVNYEMKSLKCVGEKGLPIKYRLSGINIVHTWKLFLRGDAKLKSRRTSLGETNRKRKH